MITLETMLTILEKLKSNLKVCMIVRELGLSESRITTIHDILVQAKCGNINLTRSRIEQRDLIMFLKYVCFFILSVFLLYASLPQIVLA